MSEKSILSVNDLTIHYNTNEGTVEAVNDISFDLKVGETMGLVGETGAGKTTTALGILNLVPNPPGKIVSGSIMLDGEELTKKSNRAMRKHRGKDISMIFQDPMTSLNPILKVGDQIAEVIKLHEKVSKVESIKKAAEMLELVGIPAERMDEYPHQFSGGMKQRVVIAIALACNPKVIIADEPTTALDVTIQAQVMELMKELQAKLGTSMLLITHDLGVVTEICTKVAIIYAGRIVESGNISDIYNNTKHPYTKGLFGSIPSLGKKVRRLTPIEGLMPDPSNLPSGCSFHPRCPDCMPECKTINPNNIDLGNDHTVRCLLYK